MDAAILVRVFHNRINESTRSLVQVPRLQDELGERMVCLLEEALSERRCAFLSLWIADPCLIKSLGERLCRPDFYITPRHAFDLFQDSLFPLQDLIPCDLKSVGIDTDTPHCHVNQAWEEFKLQVSDRPEIFFAERNTKVVPQLQCEFSIDFSVGSDIHGGHLPHLSLGINAKFPSSGD